MFQINRLTLAELHERAAVRKLRGAFFVDNDDYHAGPGWSSTVLKRILKSPAHADVLTPPSKAMAFGTALHCALLEPELFARDYRVDPRWEYPGNIKAGIAERKAWAEANAGFVGVFLSFDEGAAIDAIVARARASATFGKLVIGAQFELAAYWIDEDTGLLCKAKADIWNGPFIADIKTTEDASARKFGYSIVDYDYHLSNALYLDGFAKALGHPMEAFIFVAMEKARPHGISFYVLDAESIDAGRRAYKKALGLIRQYSKTPKTEWPCYPDSIQSISLTGYAKTKYENN